MHTYSIASELDADQYDAEFRRERAERLMADLTFQNYALNRDLNPHIKVDTFLEAYGPQAVELEARYQAELLAKKELKSPFFALLERLISGNYNQIASEVEA